MSLSMQGSRRYGLLIGLCVGCYALPGRAESVAQSARQSAAKYAPVYTVVVTGARTEQKLADAPVAVELISGEDIATSGAETAADLLEEHPGIEVERSFRGAGIRLQGLGTQHVLVLLDGERMVGRVDGAVDMARIPVEDIERIEIVKGPSSALYGSDAMGGVINIITRRADAPVEGELHLSTGSLQAADLSARVGLQDGDWNIRVSGGWHRLDAFDWSPATPATSGSEMWQWNIAQRTEYRLDADTLLFFRASYLRRGRRGVDSNAAGAVFDRRNVVELVTSSIGTEVDLEEGGKLRLTGSYSLFRDQFLLDQRQSTALDQQQEAREQLAQLTVQYEDDVGESHFVTTGTELFYERLSTERLEGGSGDRYRGAFFVQDEWSMSAEPLLVLVAGGRVDIDSQFGANVSPKITLRFDPYDQLTLRASYGMGFRAPGFKELMIHFENPGVGYVVEGNMALKPETSHSVHVGAEYAPVDWLWAAAGLFRNDIGDLIFPETVKVAALGAGQRYRYVNVASAFTQGMEIRLRLRPLQGLTLEGSYTLTDSRDRERGRALEGRALHRATADVRYHNEGWGSAWTLRASWVGERPFYADVDGQSRGETRRASPYATLDMRFAQRVGEHLTLFVGAENLLDAGDSDFLPMQPRTFYGGLTSRL